MDFSTIAAQEMGTSRNRIYRLIFSHDRISKPEISKALNLSLPTVIQNVRAMTGEGLLRENGHLQSNGGRKAAALSCVEDARYAVGLDITQRHITAVLVNLRGGVVQQNRVRRSFEASQSYYRALGDMVEQLAGTCREKVLGVGIALPALISRDKQVMEYSHVFRISNEKCRHIAQFIPFPAQLCNDANAAGIAELWTEPSIRDTFYLSISNSVGGAIFFRGELYEGINQRAGEFGHMTLIEGGRPCYCGKLGCVDAYCSIKSLLDDEQESLADFFAALDAGDGARRARWERYTDHLSVAVNNVRTLFDGDIIVGGYLGEQIGSRIEGLREKVAARNTFERSAAYIKPCSIHRSAAAVGAALTFVHQFIHSV